jgi:NADH-quinone oxidoreductase subunit E
MAGKVESQKPDLTKLDEIVSRYKGQDDALISVLQAVQAEYGWVPRGAIVRIADALNVSPGEVFGVLTFYAQFYLTPRGRNTIRICRGTACHVRGTNSNLRTVEKLLGIKEGETTDDFKFSLETVACLGTCFLAPVMMVNRNYYGKMTPGKAETILKLYD